MNVNVKVHVHVLCVRRVRRGGAERRGREAALGGDEGQPRAADPPLAHAAARMSSSRRELLPLALPLLLLLRSVFVRVSVLV